MGQLYKLDFPNGKSYVGITSTTAKERFRDHSARCTKSFVGNAVKKYGAANVKVSVLADFDDWEALCLLEKLAIEKWNTAAPRGYNLTYGGEGTSGHRHTEEAKAKMVARMADLEERKKLMDGRKIALEDATLYKVWRDNLREANATPESRARKSASAKVKYSNPEILAKMVSNLRSAEKRAAASALAKEKWKDPEFIARQMAARKKK